MAHALEFMGVHGAIPANVVDDVTAKAARVPEMPAELFRGEPPVEGTTVLPRSAAAWTTIAYPARFSDRMPMRPSRADARSRGAVA